MTGEDAMIPNVASVQKPTPSRFRRHLGRIRRQRVLLYMTVPLMLHLFLFQYIPLWGWIIAFKDYTVGLSVWTAPWIGFENFERLFNHPDFLPALRNTVIMNAMGLVLGTVSAIWLAVVLNELRSKWFVRTVQTMTYLPHFVSMVVLANIAFAMLSPNGGVLNEVLIKLGLIDGGIFFLGRGEWFWVLHTLILTWKNFGWSAIVYLAAIAGLDPNLYDAAEVDGAKRWQRVWYITIPGIMPTIVLLLILAIGNLVKSGFESQYLLGNVLTRPYSETVAIFVLRAGLGEGDFSFGTAIGIFESVVCVTMLLIVNGIARRYQNSVF